MENVLLGVAVALFIIGAVLAVVAGVLFVRRNVMDSIRFLQGKRVGVEASSAGRSSARRSRHGKGRGARVAGNDRTTDVASAGPGDDSPTSVVSAGQERGDDRPTTIAGAAVSRGATSGASQARYEDSELPTEILTELDASEQPTGVLSDDVQVEEDSERPTGVLTDGGDEEDASERPTGVLSEEPDDEAEAPTTVLAADADEPSEAPTGVLAIEEDEESEAATTVLADAEDEESEMPTTVLGTGEAAESSEQPTSVLEGSEPTEEPLVVEEYDERDGVVQQEESTFRFILKQNVMVVHTEESLD